MNVIEGNLPKKSDGQTKLEQCNSKSEQQSTEYLAKKIDRKRFVGNENQIKDDYDFCHDHKDCSDESTQENGSNTESAENLLCNCTKASSNDLKKIVIEKSIQTSKVTTSDSNFQKSQVKVPVYILYPNYSLPNLEFLKKKHYIQNIDFSKVFIRPQKFQSPSSQNSSPRVTPKRPFSVNDIETLKKTGFKHIKDWESLTFLLPTEYKQFLQEIPEIVSQLKEVKNIKEELVPLFCLSPPPNRKLKKRPISCDLNFFSNDYKSSNFSSTATQPSSGYRGSSTMLNSNTSSSTGSPRNAYGHKYDTNSESCSSRKSGFLAHSKHLRNFADVPPPRPPLPKGILRNNSLDNQQYTCKIQKENANKRYSMIELTDKNLDADDKGVKKRSVHNFNIHPSQPNSYKNNENKKPVNGSEMNFEKDTKESKTMELEETYYSEEQSKIQGDLRRLEELLEISAVFGESVESFTENDMIKLRSQVSKFLTMHKNLEKVSETLQTVDENSGNENFDDLTGKKFQENLSLETKCLHTPHNTPEHKKQLKGGCEKDLGKDLTGYVDSPHHSSNDYNSNTYCHNSEDCFNEETVGLKKTVSFAERISFAVKEREFQCEGTPLSSPSSLLFNQNQPQVGL